MIADPRQSAFVSIGMVGADDLGVREGRRREWWFTAVAAPGHPPDHIAFIHEDRTRAGLGDAACGSDLRGSQPSTSSCLPSAHSDVRILADESLERLLEDDFDVAQLYPRPVGL